MAYQKAYFPMEFITLSQGYGINSSTHKYSYALDLCGKNSGADKVYAPFDCKITKLYQPKDTKKHATEVWLTSTKKVLCANGYYGYLTMSITHPKEILKMRKGCTYKQGEVICYEGMTGGATGNHIHLELTKGTKTGWDKVNGTYVNKDRVKPEEYLFVKESSKVLKNTYKNKTYNFIKESDLTYKAKNIPSEPLLIHSKANYKNSSIIKNKGLKNNDKVIKFYEEGTMSYIYFDDVLGYVASKYLKK